MPHPVRRDSPDSWHHVMNRGIARRNAFEGRADVRRFLAELARAVRRGEIEVHSFCILATHYHLLVRSPVGRLATAVGRAQKEYTQYFNRTRARDGALFRGRFRSKRVGSIYYRRTLVRYIDQNPVAAGLAGSPPEYPLGSAWHYARPRGPRWLDRSWIEREVAAFSARPSYEPAEYARIFGAPLSAAGLRYVERRLVGGRNPADDAFDSLIDASPPATQRWMESRARAADGGRPELCAMEPEDLLAILERHAREDPNWRVHPTQKGLSGHEVARAALLREVAALSYAEIARRTSVSIQTALRRLKAHRRLLDIDTDYAARLRALRGEVAARIRETIHPRR